MGNIRKEERVGWWAIIRDIPAKGRGVYSVWAGDQLLYIGQSIELRRRLEYHTRLEGFLAAGVTHVLYVLVEDDLSRRCMEEWLTSKHKPVLNRDMGRSKWGHLCSLSPTRNQTIQ